MNTRLCINNTDKKIEFGSRNSPVVQFEVQTKNGKLKFKELEPSETFAAAKFSADSSIEEYEHIANQYKNSHESVRQNYILDRSLNYKRILNRSDGNSTILVGKDATNEIKALFSMHSYNGTNLDYISFYDSQTGFISECMVDKAYRGENIGKAVIPKLLETAKGQFSDVILDARNKAINFYYKCGFNILDMENKTVKQISDYLDGYRNCAKLSIIMEKSFESSSHWYDRFAEIISKSKF